MLLLLLLLSSREWRARPTASSTPKAMGWFVTRPSAMFAGTGTGEVASGWAIIRRDTRRMYAGERLASVLLVGERRVMERRGCEEMDELR